MLCFVSFFSFDFVVELIYGGSIWFLLLALVVVVQCKWKQLPNQAPISFVLGVQFGWRFHRFKRLFSFEALQSSRSFQIWPCMSLFSSSLFDPDMAHLIDAFPLLFSFTLAFWHRCGVIQNVLEIVKRTTRMRLHGWSFLFGRHNLPVFLLIHALQYAFDGR